MSIRITNIQRFSLQDGPGIRTTIFLKGCSLKCPWCSNPENISTKIEHYNLDNKEGIYGIDMDLDDLYNEIIKDQKYYKYSNGGVTFSGGEALLQFDKLEPLLKRLKEDNINICLETCLVASKFNLGIAIKYVDEFYVDVKLVESTLFQKILKGNYELFSSNIKYLFESVNKKNIIFRIPVTEEYTFNKDNLEKLDKFLSQYKPDTIEIFRIHRLGESKYKSLGIEMPTFRKVSDQNISYLIEMLNKYSNNIKINKI